MTAWDEMIEARIRDWQERLRRGEVKVNTAPSPEHSESLEMQLFRDVVELHRRARAEGDARRRHELLTEAEQVRIRLSVLLEHHGLLLMAKSLDERIRAALETPPDES